MERAIFEQAVREHRDMVFRVALHVTGQRQDAEDAVQEVFLRLYTRERDFASPEHLRRWLIRVTVNLCRDTLKSPWRKRRVYLEQLPEPSFHQVEQRELYREVMALPEKYRTVLDLFYYEELSTREIGEVLGIRQSAVTTRLARAREQLKKRLKEAWRDDE